MRREFQEENTRIEKNFFQNSEKDKGNGNQNKETETDKTEEEILETYFLRDQRDLMKKQIYVEWQEWLSQCVSCERLNLEVLHPSPVFLVIKLFPILHKHP